MREKGLRFCSFQAETEIKDKLKAFYDFQQKVSEFFTWVDKHIEEQGLDDCEELFYFQVIKNNCYTRKQRAELIKAYENMGRVKGEKLHAHTREGVSDA